MKVANVFDILTAATTIWLFNSFDEPALHLFLCFFLLQGAGDEAGPNKDITDIAAAAQSLQPTGYTLSDTLVRTFSSYIYIYYF